jgi:hypothetical protein
LRRLPSPRRTLALLLPLLLLLSSPAPADDDPAATLLLGDSYPIETELSFHFALLHWLDSLGGLTGLGMTGGKTVEAHRRQYTETLGPPDARALELMRGFIETRRAMVRRMGPEQRYALSLAFLDSSDLEQALEVAGRFATEQESAALRAALEHFAPAYREIWDEGKIPSAFLDDAREARRKKALASFLARVAAFYDVELSAPWPSVVVAPVPWGWGTHAQAIDRHLLLEIREGEHLWDQVSPIVHENAHFLFYRIPVERRDTLEAHAASLSPRGIEAWKMLHEALPTAIGQGVAGHRFSESWSIEQRWYHIDSVDQYAKLLYPLVRETLRGKGRLDEEFVASAVAIYVGRKVPVTPRSP